MPSLPLIEINPDLLVRIEQIADGHVCVIVDDFLKRPHDIVEFAVNNATAFSIPKVGYPGPLLNVDDDAMTDVYRFIRSRMGQQFSFLKGGMWLSTFLSMATLQPDNLANLQRLCHTDPRDRMDRRNYAALVYLFENEALGGTGFYQWKERELIEQATVLESEDPAKALAFLQDHFATYAKPACYITESNEIAELVSKIPARFNRMIFYSGDVPHSAAIASPELLTKDFSKGRLTLNSFASVRPC
jgi:hypothetical protein